MTSPSHSKQRRQDLISIAQKKISDEIGLTSLVFLPRVSINRNAHQFQITKKKATQISTSITSHTESNWSWRNLGWSSYFSEKQHTSSAKYYISTKSDVLGSILGGKIPLRFSPPFFLGGKKFLRSKSRISTKFKLRVVGDVVNLPADRWPLTHMVKVQGLKAGKGASLFQQKKNTRKKNKKNTGLLLVAIFSVTLKGLKFDIFFQTHDEKNATNPIENNKNVNCIDQPMPKCKTFLTQSSDGSGSIGEILNWEQNHYRVVAIVWKNERIGIWRITTSKK